MRPQTLSLAAVLTLTAAPAWAAGCFPIAQAHPGIQVVSLETDPQWLNASLGEPSVEIRYLGHSTYHMTTSDGIIAVTDYYGLPLENLPDIATMNNAHSTHFTLFPDPEIGHVLHGWGEGNSIATHDIEVGEIRVRTVPTSVHGRSGGETNSNSIFVFELRDLCIAHLGHLHHVLEDLHLAELGVIDILMVPIDGIYTMSQIEMVKVVEQIDPAIVLPMHYFGFSMLERFTTLLGERWNVEVIAEPSVSLSRQDLPNRTVMVLPITSG